MNERKNLLLTPLTGYSESIGTWLAALQDTRARTLRVLEDIASQWLDFVPEGGSESIGTILYHLAAIEVDWLYEDVIQTPFPPEIEAMFVHDVRDEAGSLTPVSDTMQHHLDRLRFVRGRLLEVFSSMTPREFETPRGKPQYDISPVYVIHHLMQHEAEHRSQINWIGMQAKMVLGGKMPKENL